jgi:hypothetical protein
MSFKTSKKRSKLLLSYFYFKYIKVELASAMYKPSKYRTAKGLPLMTAVKK